MRVSIESCTDHPRTCGEKNNIRADRGNNIGSPPHMRGKEMFEELYSTGERITPAHAGKSYENSEKIVEMMDHPRTCGEKNNIRADRGNNIGSPPHMRGKVLYGGCT